MPIYEYKCGGCTRRVSLFFATYSAAESRSAAGELKCPRCGSPEIQKVMSRARTMRPVGAGLNEFSENDDTLLGAGINEDDPREIARWARHMRDSMGEDVNLGPGFDQAISRIEAGEDPDRVLDDMDPDMMDMGGSNDQALQDLDYEDDDFGPSSIGLG